MQVVCVAIGNSPQQKHKEAAFNDTHRAHVDRSLAKSCVGSSLFGFLEGFEAQVWCFKLDAAFERGRGIWVGHLGDRVATFSFFFLTRWLHKTRLAFL